ncbi:hypothetical protein QQF64_031932 [Cirrhinus molitorella]|uniref:Ig-like domain-containing protein n=1 Tax=Cirrhinus molitorella TaxID=172907 RepID=A0ABR3MYC7_9TELE
MLMLVSILSCWKIVSAGVSTGSHSLMALATYIDGQTQFPEFSAVLMLDDVQVGYYDSVTWTPIYRTHSDSKYYDEERSDAGVVFRAMYKGMKDRAFYLKKQQNYTDGVLIQQRIAGCELNNDIPGPVHFWDAFGGQNMEEFIFDKQKNDIQIKKPWMISWDQVKLRNVKLMYETFYYPICIKVLRRYLNMEKNNVMRKVKPRVRLMKKMLPDSQGLQISCLATGFYPRHINLTLFRDGQPVNDDQLTGGEILSNGDGTYQMRKSLVINEEELCEGHKYNCSMKHLNLDNKLDITFDSDVAECHPGYLIHPVVSGVLVFIFVAVLIIIIWRKRWVAGRGSGTSQGTLYSPTPSSMQDRI